MMVEILFAVENKMPSNWALTTVGNIYKMYGGGTPSTAVAKYWNGDIPWITGADIHGLKDIRARKRITQEAIANSTTYLAPARSIIVVTRVSLGKVALTEEPLCISQDSHALVGNESLVYPEYALYYLSKTVQKFKFEYRGTTIKGVTTKQLFDLPFVLPPLNEQKRIVVKIEELFTKLDAGIESLKKAKIELKRYRQSVLKAAFQGNLTLEWRKRHPIPNIKTKHDSDSYGVGESPWLIQRLSDLAIIDMGQSPPGTSYNSEGRGVPLLNGPTEFRHRNPVAVQWTIEPTKICQINDILLCVRGNTTGRINLADKPYCIGRGLAAIRTTGNFLMQNF